MQTIAILKQQLRNYGVILGTTEDFSGRGMFRRIGHFDKHFVKMSRKKGTAGKNFGVFSPRYTQNYILNGKFNPRMDTIMALFSKIRALLSIFKKGQWRSPTHFLNSNILHDFGCVCNSKGKECTIHCSSIRHHPFITYTKFSEKLTNFPLIHTKCQFLRKFYVLVPIKVVRNVSFSENFAYLLNE